MNKTILFFNTNEAWGGGEKWHFEMALALKNEGFNTVLFCHKDSALARKGREQGIKVIEQKLTHYSFLNPIKKKSIYKLIKEINPKAIIFNSPQDIKLAAPLAAKLGIERKVYRRGMPHPIKATTLNKWLYSHIDTIIANSNEIKNSICKYLPMLSEKTVVISNGVYPKDCELQTIRAPYRLGNLARLVEQKGHDKLLNLALILKKRHFPFHLKIAGTGPNEKLIKDFISTHDLQNEVELQGYIPSDQFFQNIDLFIFTSLFEGSANALIESLQHGIPAIAFDLSSNPEVVADKCEGYLIPAFDLELMADRIISLLSDNELYKSFHQNALLKVENHFNYHQKIKELKQQVGFE